MHSFPEDVFVFVFVDVFALIVRFDGKLHLLHCPFLGMQFLQILDNSGKRQVKIKGWKLQISTFPLQSGWHVHNSDSTLGL